MEHQREAVEEQAPVVNQIYRYRECTKNQAVAVNGFAYDGCGEFMPAGPEGSIEALHCMACHCHRNYHRREPISQNQPDARFQQHLHQHHQQYQQPQPYNYYRPAGVLVTGPRVGAGPFTQASTSRDPLQGTGNPSSSGAGVSNSGRKSRTKFTSEQKARMLSYAMAIEWKMKRENKSAIQEFCNEIGVTRQVFKVWMHNHKNTLGQKP